MIAKNCSINHGSDNYWHRRLSNTNANYHKTILILKMSTKKNNLESRYIYLD